MDKGIVSSGQSICRIRFNSGKMLKESFDLLDVWKVPVGHKPNTFSFVAPYRMKKITVCNCIKWLVLSSCLIFDLKLRLEDDFNTHPNYVFLSL